LTAAVRNVRDVSRGSATVLLAYATFVLVGIGAGGGGVMLLAQMSDYGVDRSTIGITFFTLSAGYVLAGLATGALVGRFGIRIALAAGGGGYALAGLYLAIRPPFAAFVLVQLVAGFGVGVLESALNVYLAALPGATTRLNRLHAFFGVGALIGPVLAARIVAVSSWRVVWLVMALACVPLVAGFLAAYPGRAFEPAADRVRDPAGDPAGDPIGDPAGRGLLRATLREPGVLLGAAMLAVYVGVEISVGNWGFSYLVQARALSSSLAGYAVSGYWLGLTVGRFVISPVAAKAGMTTAGMMYGCLGGVAAAVTLAWLSPVAAVTCAALVLLGFFLGPVFPTTMAIAPLLTRPALVPTAMGVINAASVVGGSVLPWLAGAIAQSTGIWTLLPYSLALAALQFAVWRPLARRILPSLRGVLAPVRDGGPFGVELAESGVRACTVDGGGAAVHQERDADRFRCLGGSGPVPDRRVSVGGDAPVALLADCDSQGDKLLDPDIQHARAERGVMELPVALVHVRDRVPQLAGWPV
jgi:fucose permease